MPTPNQIFKRYDEVNISAMDLLNMNMPGTVTENGIRKNLEIGLGYMEGWLRGVGCVPINYLMEDAATAEVSRSQVGFHLTVFVVHQGCSDFGGTSCGNGQGMASAQRKARKSQRSTISNF